MVIVSNFPRQIDEALLIIGPWKDRNKIETKEGLLGASRK
jgi:hypothetical protein